jgi:hypothetical protein
MKRNIIVGKLIKKGLSESTLVKMTDNQINQLAERMLGEDITTTAAAMQKSPQIQQMAKTPGQNIKLVGEESKKSKKCEHCGKDMSNCSCDDSHMDEELKGKQKNIDKNHNGKIDAEDFKLLNKEKQQTPKETKEGNKFSGELAKAKSQHKDSFNVDGKKYDVKEVKNWVNNLAENKLYHSFTSKNEIMDLIQTKLNESATMTHKFGPSVKKGHNGVPEFMTYDSITSSGPATAPTKPKPTVKPGQKPKTPYQPGPGPNHKPKALALSEKKSGPATAPTKPKPTTKPGTKPKKDNPYSPKPGPNHKPKALAEKKVK